MPIVSSKTAPNTAVSATRMVALNQKPPGNIISR